MYSALLTGPRALWLDADAGDVFDRCRASGLELQAALGGDSLRHLEQHAAGAHLDHAVDPCVEKGVEGLLPHDGGGDGTAQQLRQAHVVEGRAVEVVVDGHLRRPEERVLERHAHARRRSLHERGVEGRGAVDALHGLAGGLVLGQGGCQGLFPAGHHDRAGAAQGTHEEPAALIAALAQGLGLFWRDVFEVGATAELAATVNSGAALSYASSDETVATVSAEGVVTAVKEGTATITVSAPAQGIYTAASAEVTVTVTAPATGDEPRVLYTLDTNNYKGTNNSYTGNCDIVVEGITWNVTGNSTMNPWRIGGKSLNAVDREVYTKTAFSNALTSVDVTFGTASSITVNSCKLLYSTNADFSDASEVSVDFAAESTVSFVADFPANAYYKLVLNVTVSSDKNKFVQLSKIEFIGK